MKRKAVRETVFFFGFLEETARVPERRFGHGPPGRENPTPDPKTRRREKTLYMEETERINAKKRSGPIRPHKF
jgi:hypothetical protein